MNSEPEATVGRSERELFLAALEKHDLRERTAFLKTACRSDRALRERLERMLDQEAVIGDTVDRLAPPSEPAATELGGQQQPLCRSSKLVTLDAMHTQTETGRIIVQERGADFLRTAKGNQPGVAEAAPELAEPEPGPSDKVHRPW